MADSPYEALLDAVEARLATLDLEDGLAGRIVRREGLPESAKANRALIAFEMPVLVTSCSGTEGLADDLTDSLDDGHRYPATVRIMDRNTAVTDRARMSRHLKNRKTIRDAFHRQPLAGFVGVAFVPGPVIEADFFILELLSVPLAFSATTAEPRP